MTKYSNNWLNLPVWAISTVVVLPIKIGKKVSSIGYRANYKSVDSMSGLKFERLVAKLLRSKGFEHIRLTEKYDLGIDIIAQKDGVTWGIQVKRYSGLVGANAVRQAVTALSYYKCDRAMVVTNSKFSKAAKALAAANDCVLKSEHIS